MALNPGLNGDLYPYKFSIFPLVCLGIEDVLGKWHPDLLFMVIKMKTHFLSQLEVKQKLMDVDYGAVCILHYLLWNFMEVFTFFS